MPSDKSVNCRVLNNGEWTDKSMLYRNLYKCYAHAIMKPLMQDYYVKNKGSMAKDVIALFEAEDMVDVKAHQYPDYEAQFAGKSDDQKGIDITD